MTEYKQYMVMAIDIHSGEIYEWSELSDEFASMDDMGAPLRKKYTNSVEIIVAEIVKRV